MVFLSLNKHTFNLWTYELPLHFQIELDNVNQLRINKTYKMVELTRYWGLVEWFWPWIPGSLKIYGNSITPPLTNQSPHILDWHKSFYIVLIVISTTCHSIVCTKTRPNNYSSWYFCTSGGISANTTINCIHNIWYPLRVWLLLLPPTFIIGEYFF